MREGVEVRLAPGDRERLKQVVGDRMSSQKHAWRARIVLMTAEGHGTMAIRTATGKSKPTIWRWQARYMAAGFDSLFKDAPRGRGKPKLDDAVIRRVVATTLHEKPAAATHWSVRSLGKHVGISHTSVQRIWHAHGLKPHKVATFKLSNDPEFADKVRDIVGLYMNPPEHALVLSVDEKSQIQALDRTQPGLPMKRGRAATMTHDYKRNGVTTLFAALNILEGKVIGQCMLRHRATEFVRFLRTIDKNTPANRELHLILDNYATHKTVAVKQWLSKHPRFHVHFTPTSASWLNAIEGFFAILTKQRLKRGVFHSVLDLNQAIRHYIEAHNATSSPFTWTAPASAIIEKVNRGKHLLESLH